MKVANKEHLPGNCLREKCFVGLVVAHELIGSRRGGACDELSPGRPPRQHGGASVSHPQFFLLVFKSVILSLLKGNLGCGPRGCDKFCDS